MIPQERTWLVSDAPFNPGKLHHTETIYTIGNGYMGLRGSFEEGYPNSIVSTLIHGVYNHAEGELVPDLVNLPNPLAVTVEVDGEAFHMTAGKILGYQRTLDLKRAVLTRSVLWQNSKGRIVSIQFERFASLQHDHVLAQRVSVRALNGSADIAVIAGIDGTQTSMGVQHWATLDTGHDGAKAIHTVGKTNQSGYTVAVASTVSSSKGRKSYRAMGDRQPAIRVAVGLERDEAVEIVKLSAIHSTRDAKDPLAAALNTLAMASAAGYEALLSGHAAEWDACWHDSGIDIEGDEAAQRAIRFCTYHVLIAAPRHDERASIGAKTLSGPGYKGHVFWDTELFMVPLLTLTQPKLARNLLMYRYHNLEGARHKAKKAGYEGAMFPWESTDTGEETTPQWTNPGPDGKRIRIWTGDNEQHISSDIAYAVMQFYAWTGDEAFFLKHGAEIVLDTAVFWGSRVEHNQSKDRYEISQQIGPDEYHENVNNSVFTNMIVRWHLRAALEVVAWLKERHTKEAGALLKRLKIDEARLNHWRTVADKMYIPYDNKRGIYEQFDGFFDLEPLELSYWQPRVMNMDAILGHATTQKTMVIKQADVVMMMALLGEATGTLEERQRNWDFYYKIVDHGSSLSPSTHAWVAARLGLIEDAYDMFSYAGHIDLEDLKGNVRDGIHAAASGGLWEAVVWGFAGLSLSEGTFKLEPNLPDHWKSVRFRFYHRGKQHTVTLTQE